MADSISDYEAIRSRQVELFGDNGIEVFKPAPPKPAAPVTPAPSSCPCGMAPAGECWCY